ncbi:MAG: TerB family tellurite resistance protein [Cyanobacteria bacterium]|uniref:tellurite resistance TerB family protein n=1 Tax=Geminocystis sp. TaxID=2664100 RepID=UPI001D8D7A50|nr:TerB family tellurite resistance protein [Cyanobacteria bacterium CG_2015-16_32_12]NCO79313.1 TerB family tellurite resistance protein [Cyanobacteria bacterium CG_2015-22_32_23]NCQ05039.1 TerB family tellurite resistance protein [Cyanobacteria bacterium CG_2015-09_32_10]NCQ41337.1 TerB family tellurite resistance protein [Cyanobacteria bacterium CG_2015-04_32_10]NCS84050.1 TerB family tellurite resistance protein [Cyanobacteria bacterium CG_2015-02_32_10]
MTTQNKTKLLVKILVGTAWIDGIIQPQERQYLQKVVTENNLNDDAEIKSLLSEIKPINPQECYQWLEEYLGKNPTIQDYEELLGSISALVYSDGDVDIQEAKLLNKLQNLDPYSQEKKSGFEQIINSIRQLYNKAISSN